MEYAFFGLVVAFNFVFILLKLNSKRFQDAIVDIFIFTIITFMFVGSASGMYVGCIASMFISIYLFFNPPLLFKSKNQSEILTEVEDFIKFLTSK